MLSLRSGGWFGKSWVASRLKLDFGDRACGNATPRWRQVNVGKVSKDARKFG